jgi:arabinogalactan oligomer/maltooligosaccharide transport system permease protein
MKIILTVFTLLAGLLLFFVMAGHALRTARALGKHFYSYIMIFPAMVGLIALVLLPFLYGLSMAFFRVPPSQGGNWVFIGLQNFVEILSDFQPLTPGNFYFVLLVTVMWTVINVFLHVCIGLAMAIILNRPDFPLKRVYRVLLILPWAMPNYITALIWKGMFHKQFGAFNAFIKLLGFEPISFFNNFWTAFFANVSTNTWLGFPFMMVICLGALQSIPSDLYEAAQIDGASKWQQFKSVTMPLLKPALFPAIVLGTIWTFNMFNIIYLVSNGEPNRSTDILITQAYRFAFEKFNWGYAAAYSILIFLILLTYGIFTNRVTKATEGIFD